MNLARKIIDELNEEEKVSAYNWAKDAKVIVNNPELSQIEKLKELHAINTKYKSIEKVLKGFYRIGKKHCWDDRGWAARLGIIGLSLGGIFSGSGFAGIATAGWGIGLPVFLLTTAGGTFLGTLIDEFLKEKK